MIKDNEIVFVNPKIGLILERSKKEYELFMKSPEEGMRKKREKSIQKLGEDIIGGYWDTLLGEAMMGRLRNRKWIDFTYDTIGKLPYSLISLYQLQKANGYSRARNATVIGKTIGAVMCGLAMNEHGYALTVERGKKEPLWADLFRIYIDGIQKVDFLEPALQSVSSPLVVMQKGLSINMTPVIEAYQMATGVNLAEHEFVNIMISDD